MSLTLIFKKAVNGCSTCFFTVQGILWTSVTLLFNLILARMKTINLVVYLWKQILIIVVAVPFGLLCFPCTPISKWQGRFILYWADIFIGLFTVPLRCWLAFLLLLHLTELYHELISTATVNKNCCSHRLPVGIDPSCELLLLASMLGNLAEEIEK